MPNVAQVHLPLRRCAECRKPIPPRKLATALHVNVGPTPGWMTITGPLCSIACGCVAASKLLEGVKA